MGSPLERHCPAPRHLLLPGSVAQTVYLWEPGWEGGEGEEREMGVGEGGGH